MTRKTTSTPTGSSYKMVGTPVDTVEANAAFQAYFNDTQKLEFEQATQALEQETAFRITVNRDGFIDAFGEKHRRRTGLDLIQAGGAGGWPAVDSLVKAGWLIKLDERKVLKREQAKAAEWVVRERRGPPPWSIAAVKPFGIVDCGEAITQQHFQRQTVETKKVWDPESKSEIHIAIGGLSDGRDAMMRLIEKGLIVPGPGHKGKASEPKRYDVIFDDHTGKIEYAPKKGSK